MRLWDYHVEDESEKRYEKTRMPKSDCLMMANRFYSQVERICTISGVPETMVLKEATLKKSTKR